MDKVWFYILLLICGGVIGFFLHRHQAAEIDKKTQQINTQLKEENEKLSYLYESRQKQILELTEAENKKRNEMKARLQKEEIIEQQKISEKIVLEFELEREKLKQKIAEISQNEFNQLSIQLEENRLNFEAKTTSWNSELETLAKEVEELRAKKRALIEAAKHEEEIAQQKDFYRLQVDDDVIEDVIELKKL